jgi:hypothetical protein
MTKITTVLQQIQSRLVAPKSQRNTFGNYNYRSCEDILNGLKPLLAELGGVVTLSDEMVDVGGRIYVKATALLDVGGDSLRGVCIRSGTARQKGHGRCTGDRRNIVIRSEICVEWLVRN